MLKNLMSSAAFAGLGAGLIAALLQFVFVIPLLLEGELYEVAARTHFGAGGIAQSISQAPALGGDIARHAMTVAFNVTSYTGYGLILAALMGLAKTKGHGIGARQGLIWGLCGFIAVQFAPALGLPPELPGTVGAELLPRQMWWAGTIVATASGLGLICFATGWKAAAGVVLIAVPHVIGAPHLDTFFGVAPPELAAHFATASLGVGAAGWCVLGLLVAHFQRGPAR
ncbi:MAG: cobalt transporter subunit CbtA [Paracoccaceae bacterium]|jgi:cobalt transporter subunit CbtA